MKEEKIKNLLRFYLLATELKDKIRRGWIIWNIDRERIESVAEHIYGTCILAIAIDSEFDLGINLQKVVIMLVLHELEEIQIEDITMFDNVTEEEKREMGQKAVDEILTGLSKKQEYFELVEEFNNNVTKEAKFAKMCDKLEADIQSKLYCEENCLQTDKEENQVLRNDARIAKMIQQGEKTISDFFIENDRPKFKQKQLEEILDFVKIHSLLDMKEEK